MKYKVLGFLVGLSFLVGCSSIPIDRKTGKVDTNYDFSSQQDATGKKIVVLAPQGYFVKPVKKVNISVTDSSRLTYDPVQITEIKDAYRHAFEKIITTKGFTFTGPFENFEQIPYRDKKEGYLALEPHFEFNVSKTGVALKNHISYTKETGSLTAQGIVKIRLIEPLTQQVMFVKKIDINAFDLSEPYIIEREKKTDYQAGLLTGMMEGAVKSSAKPKMLTDDYHLAYSKVLTRFYQKVVSQMDIFISREELLSYQEDISGLKDRKRF